MLRLKIFLSNYTYSNKILYKYLHTNVPFSGTRGGGLRRAREDTDDVIDVIDLLNPLSSPSVWFWSENILRVFVPADSLL